MLSRESIDKNDRLFLYIQIKILAKVKRFCATKEKMPFKYHSNKVISISSLIMKKIRIINYEPD